MDDVTRAGGLPLWSEYTGFVRRRIVAIGALTMVGLLLGLGWAWQQPASYSATASVVLTPVPKYVAPSTGDSAPPPVTIDTDAQLLRSHRVLAAVAEVVGGDPDSADRHLTVTASPHTRVLHVTVSAGSATTAADAANAAVAALAEVRRSTLGALRLDQMRQLRFLIDEQERQVAAEGSAEVAAYDRQATQILELERGLTSLEEARARPLEVVTSAAPPPGADYANTEVPVVSGAMVGLLCGCLLARARDRAGGIPHGLVRPAPAPQPIGGPLSAAPTHRSYHHVD